MEQQFQIDCHLQIDIFENNVINGCQSEITILSSSAPSLCPTKPMAVATSSSLALCRCRPSVSLTPSTGWAETKLNTNRGQSKYYKRSLLTDKYLLTRLCKLFSESSIGVPALLPVAPLPAASKWNLSEKCLQNLL